MRTIAHFRLEHVSVQRQDWLRAVAKVRASGLLVTISTVDKRTVCVSPLYFVAHNMPNKERIGSNGCVTDSSVLDGGVNYKTPHDGSWFGSVLT